MKPKKYKVYLAEQERTILEKLIRTGKHAAQKIIRANVLLHLDENEGTVGSQDRIAEQCKVSTALIYKVSKQYVEEGIEAILERKKRETPPIQPIATGDPVVSLPKGEPGGRCGCWKKKWWNCKL